MITPIVHFFSDPLRLTLLVVGIIVVILVYFISRRPKLSKTALAEENKAVHPSQYQDLPEERGGVGKVSVRKASEKEKMIPKPKSILKTFRKDDETEVDGATPSLMLDEEVEGVGAVTIKPAPTEKNEKPKPERKEKSAAATDEKVEKETPRVAERVKLSREKKQKVIVVYLKAEEGRRFGGRLFVSAMHEVGLEMGDRGVFHHYAKDQSHTYINFSVANIHEPGTFDLSRVDDFATDGLSLFMQVPMETGNASLAFTQMMSAAQRLARRLGGKLYTAENKPLNVPEINVMRIDVEKYM